MWRRSMPQFSPRWSRDRSGNDSPCELNVIEQVTDVAQTTVLESAWERGQEITIHGWVYRLANGLVNPLKVDIASHELIDETRSHAVKSLIKA